MGTDYWKAPCGKCEAAKKKTLIEEQGPRF